MQYERKFRLCASGSGFGTVFRIAQKSAVWIAPGKKERERERQYARASQGHSLLFKVMRI
jgi:hypothetical protein